MTYKSKSVRSESYLELLERGGGMLIKGLSGRCWWKIQLFSCAATDIQLMSLTRSHAIACTRCKLQIIDGSRWLFCMVIIGGYSINNANEVLVKSQKSLFVSRIVIHYRCVIAIVALRLIVLLLHYICGRLSGNSSLPGRLVIKWWRWLCLAKIFITINKRCIIVIFP